MLTDFDYVFSENGLVAYKAGQLLAVQVGVCWAGQLLSAHAKDCCRKLQGLAVIPLCLLACQNTGVRPMSTPAAAAQPLGEATWRVRRG